MTNDKFYNCGHFVVLFGTMQSFKFLLLYLFQLNTATT